MTKNATLHLIYSLISYPLSTYFISTYFFQICHLLLKIKLMKKFRLPLKVRINIDTKQTGHLSSDVSKQQFLKSCLIFSIYLQLIDYIRTLSDADLRLCLEEHFDEKRTKQQAEHILTTKKSHSNNQQFLTWLFREALLKCVFFSNLLSSFPDFTPLAIALTRHLS